MINKDKNKRLEITLTNEDWELLNSICFRFKITKSEAIKQSLKVFAAKRKHYITLSYREKNIEDEPLPKQIKENNPTLKKDQQKLEQEFQEMLDRMHNDQKKSHENNESYQFDDEPNDDLPF